MWRPSGRGDVPARHEVLAEGPADRDGVVAEVFDTAYPQLVRLARFLVDDQASAEDVVMEAFTNLYRRWRSLRDPHDAYRYVRSCVLNGARSQLRRRRVVRLHAAPGVDPERVPGRDEFGPSDERADVLSRLRGLPHRQREVLVLRYYLDLSEAEIAAELGISAGSVKTHASRGLAALATALEVRP
ncbi:SigE family RNA polymerase sigma factor [Nocardioides sp. GCM10027113]|uniref:SigE family RNA polymerase sigma factor n=1 Tax=unclassified Nocardioides TaxID=2615069 RepID=UPI003617FC73